MTDEQRPAVATDEDVLGIQQQIQQSGFRPIPLSYYAHNEVRPITQAMRREVPIESLLVRIDQQRETIAALQDRADRLEKQLADNVSVYEELKARTDRANAYVAPAIEHVLALQARADRAEADAQSAQEGLEKYQASASKRNLEKIAEIVRLNSQLAQARAEVERLKALPRFRLEPLDIHQLIQEQDDAGGGCTDPRCRRGPHHHTVERKEIGFDGVAYSDVIHYGYPKDCSTCAALAPASDPTGSPTK